MHVGTSAVSVLLGLTVLVGACSSTGPSAPRTGSEQPQAAPSARKSLAIALGGEPEYILMANLGGGGGTGTISQNFRLAVHQQLVTYDDRGSILPMLASEVPSQGDGSWVVRPDGTMQTTYRLRRDVVWHDGAPLTARDFVFAWTVSRDSDLPLLPTLARRISRIDTPDDYTLVMEWTDTSPTGNAIVGDELGPLPTHILADAYAADKQRFQQLPYWKRDFVGVGPFRMDNWEPGSHLVLVAHDRFYAGRPKLDQIVLRFITSEQTVVADLLANHVDGALDNKAISFTQAMFVKREWERAGRVALAVVQTTHWRFVGVQFRNPTPRDVLDVRVRRALLHAIDREALVNTVLEGQAPVSDAFIPPDDPRYGWVRDVIARYPYDVRQSQQLFGDMGWRSGSDGLYVGADGERVTIPIWTTAGGQSEQELAIIADAWRNAGVNVDQSVIPEPLMRDSRARANFLAFDVTSIPLSDENTFRRLHSGACPSEQTRWQGNNRGCYQDTAMDQSVDALLHSIDAGQQQALLRQIVKTQTEAVGVLPLYFNINVAIFRQGVTGIKGDTSPRTSVSWNAAEWDVT